MIFLVFSVLPQNIFTFAKKSWFSKSFLFNTKHVCRAFPVCSQTSLQFVEKTRLDFMFSVCATTCFLFVLKHVLGRNKHVFGTNRKHPRCLQKAAKPRFRKTRKRASNTIFDKPQTRFYPCLSTNTFKNDYHPDRRITARHATNTKLSDLVLRYVVVASYPIQL